MKFGCVRYPTNSVPTMVKEDTHYDKEKEIHHEYFDGLDEKIDSEDMGD